MAYQMVYTSVKSGLVAGRSGFCTAARHKEIREALVSRIEDLSSQFDRGTAGTGLGAELPVLYSHRIVSIREQHYHVLMRVADAGNDYSGRTNHIAHSIILEPGEMEGLRVTPGEAILELIRRGIWIERFDGAAKHFGPEEEIKLDSFSPSTTLPAKEWEAQVGGAAGAAFLVEPKASGGVGVVAADGYDPELFLRLFSESALLKSPDRSSGAPLWTHSFTTLLQSVSQRTDYDWHGCVYNSQVHLQQMKANRHLIELSSGITLPSGALAEIAQGRQQAAPAESTGNAAVPAAVPDQESDPMAPATVVTPATVLDPSPAEASPENHASPVADAPATSAIPTDLLSDNEKSPSPSRSRGGLFLTLGVVGVFLLVGAVLALLFFSPVRVAERELSSTLKNGDWIAAAGVLNAIDEETQDGFVDKSAEFSQLKSLIEGYEKLVANYKMAAYETEKFLRLEAQRQGDPLREMARSRKSWEREVGISRLDFPLPDDLDRMEKEATETVHGYFKQKKIIAENWSALIGMQMPEVEVSKVREDVFALDTDTDLLLGELGDMEAVLPFVESFREVADKVHPDVASKQAAMEALNQLSGKLTTLEARAAGRDWSKYISAVRTKIATYEPAIKMPAVAVTEDPAAGVEKESAKGEAEATPEPESLLPPTYLVPLLPNSNRISYAGIEEMAAGFPASLAIRPAASYSDQTMEFKKELAEIGGEISMYYFTGSDTVKIFSVDEQAKAMVISDGFRAAFPKGFLLGFGKVGQPKPDFLLAGQVPSSADAGPRDGSYFLELPIEDGIRKVEGTGLVLGLGQKARDLVGEISFAGVLESYELVLSDGGDPVAVEGAEMESLGISLSEGMDQKVTAQEERIEKYESLRDVAASFDQIFSNLGDQLFGLEDGTAKTEGLLINSVKQPGGRPPQFELAAAPNEIEEIPTQISPTLDDYIGKSGDFIEGPPFLHYLSVHLFDALWDNGIADSRAMDREVQDQLRDAFGKMNVSDDEGVEGIKEALKAIGLVSEISSGNKLAGLPGLTEMFPNQKEAEAARKRKEKYYRKDQVVARFFRSWEKAFAQENKEVLEAMLVNGGRFDEAALEKMKSDLERMKEQQASLAETSLQELGSFFVNAVVNTPEGTKVVYRVLRMVDGK